MFQHQGIWLPDGEKHFPLWMSKHGELVNGKGTYQIKKFREAMRHVKQFRTAIDVGAHVGLWSMHMHDRFERVEAFEPVPQFRECFAANIPDTDGQMIVLHDCALGATCDMVRIVVDPADTGGTHVGDPDKPGIEVPLYTIDSYEFADVDFIKIDCEGYELEVLKGARDTLKRCKPCVIVEQKPHKLEPNFGIKGKPAVDYLLRMGAVLRREMGGDFIMSWDA